jgi:hypothetical protein
LDICFGGVADIESVRRVHSQASTIALKDERGEKPGFEMTPEEGKQYSPAPSGETLARPTGR